MNERLFNDSELIDWLKDKEFTITRESQYDLPFRLIWINDGKLDTVRANNMRTLIEHAVTLNVDLED